MKILAIGGCGSMGRFALTAAQNFAAVQQIVVADIDLPSAQTFAAALNEKVSAIQLDVTDQQRLRAAMQGFDLVVNTCGPYFKFAVPILQAAIDSRCHYLDLCDDWEPTLEMMKLDSQAKEAGICATIGLGASPGLTNLLALTAIRELDSVSTVFTGWDMGSATLDEIGAAQDTNAALLHGVEQMTGTVKIYADNIFKMVKPLGPVTVDYPGRKPFVGNIFGHPEALTFPHYFPELTHSINLAHGGDANAFLVKLLIALVNFGLLGKSSAAKLFGWLEGQSQTQPQQKRKSTDDPPAMYGFAQGLKNGVPTSVGVSLRNDEDGLTDPAKVLSMGDITGIPLACGIKLMAEGAMNQMGVLAPEAGHIDPRRFIDDVLAELSQLKDVPFGGFEDSVEVSRSW